MSEDIKVVSMTTRGPYVAPESPEEQRGPDPNVSIFIEHLKAMNDAGRLTGMVFVAFDPDEGFFSRGHLLPDFSDPIGSANHALAMIGTMRMLEQDLLSAVYNLGYEPPEGVEIE